MAFRGTGPHEVQYLEVRVVPTENYAGYLLGVTITFLDGTLCKMPEMELKRGHDVLSRSAPAAPGVVMLMAVDEP